MTKTTSDQIQDAITLDADRVRAELDRPTLSLLVYQCAKKPCRKLSWIAAPDAGVVLGVALGKDAPKDSLPPRRIRCRCGKWKDAKAAWRVPRHAVPRLAQALSEGDPKPFDTYTRFDPKRLLLGAIITDDSLRVVEAEVS